MPRRRRAYRHPLTCSLRTAFGESVIDSVADTYARRRDAGGPASSATRDQVFANRLAPRASSAPPLRATVLVSSPGMSVGRARWLALPTADRDHSYGRVPTTPKRDLAGLSIEI